MTIDQVKSALNNRIIQLVIAFVAGGFAATLLLPEKTIIKKDTQIVYKDKIVEKQVIKWKTKIQYKDRTIDKEVKKTKTKITYPNGKIVETEVYESNSQQIDRMRQIEQDKAQTQMAEMQREYEKKESYLKETINPKRFSIYGGAGLRLNDWSKKFALGGFNYPLWGPFLIGGEVNTDPGAAITFGLRF